MPAKCISFLRSSFIKRKDGGNGRNGIKAFHRRQMDTLFSRLLGIIRKKQDQRIAYSSGSSDSDKED